MPELSLRRVLRFSIMVPSGSTTSSPKTQLRVIPYRKTRSPPAFVEMIPPTCAEPLAPKLRGRKRFWFSADSRTFSSMAPASAVTVRFWGSTGSIRFIFSRDSTSWSALVCVPPTRFVSPPCTTTFCWFLWHHFIMMETSWVVLGKQTPLHCRGSSVFQMCEKRLCASMEVRLPGIFARSSSILGWLMASIYQTKIHKPVRVVRT